MTQKWHADIDVTLEIAKHCIEEQFPQLLPINEIKCIGEGWDNKVFLINQKNIFRFPRRKIAVELIERETTVLDNLYGKIDIAIPEPNYKGKPTYYYPYPFQGYAMLPGISACHAQLSFEQRIKSLPVLTRFLKQLHAFTAEQAYAIGARSQVFDRIDIPKTSTTLRERLAQIEELKICSINTKQFEYEIAAVKDLKMPEHDYCLVHGDLYCRHLLFNRGQLSAIIDWGDVGINNKAVDLAVIWEFYPAEYHAQFFAEYGAVDEITWQYARFLALYGSALLIAYGHDIDDKLLVAEAIDNIRRVSPSLLE